MCKLTYLHIVAFEAKNRVFEFDYQKINMFEFDQFSKKQCSSLFDELFSKSGEALQDLMFDICSFEAKNRVFMFDHQQMNTFGRSSLFDVRIMMLEFVQCLIK